MTGKFRTSSGNVATVVMMPAPVRHRSRPGNASRAKATQSTGAALT